MLRNGLERSGSANREGEHLGGSNEARSLETNDQIGRVDRGRGASNGQGRGRGAWRGASNDRSQTRSSERGRGASNGRGAWRGASYDKSQTRSGERGRGAQIGQWRGRGAWRRDSNDRRQTSSGERGRGAWRGASNSQEKGRGASNARGRGNVTRPRGCGRGGYNNYGNRGRGEQQGYATTHDRTVTGSRTKPQHRQILHDLEEKTGAEILIALLKQKSDLHELLQASPIDQSLIPTLLTLLDRACSTTNMSQLLSQALCLIQSSSFLSTDATQYVTSAGHGLNCHEQMMGYKKSLVCLMRVLREMLTKTPHSYTSVASIVPSLEFTVNKMKLGTSADLTNANSSRSLVNVQTECDLSNADDSKSLDEADVVPDVLGSNDVDIDQHVLDKDMQRELQLLVHQRNGAAQIIRDQPHSHKESGFRYIQPPNDFREMSIFPTTDDVLSADKPFLRVNKIKGKYEDVETYLDIQFRLLREDCLGPLRSAISEFIQNKKLGASVHRLQDGRVYNGVHIGSPECSANGITHNIKFDVSRMGRVNWQSSRRLIFGSLVCLSKDDFKSFLIATVSEREWKDLERGKLELNFQHNREAVAGITDVDSYTMIETTAYFEAYRPILKALQETSQVNLPFQTYIVDCNGDVQLPVYLRFQGAISYNLTALASGHARVSNIENISVLEPGKWPDTDHLQFDNSQLKAVQSALTKEFVVIQGPPGTGKTFVGLKIVRVLLENRDRWSAGEKSPILVVCFTNHALDQFLEGLDGFLGSGIVRVGGRSKSEKMEKYLLKNLKRSRDRRLRNRAIEELMRGVTYDIDELKSKILHTSAKIRAANKGIIHESTLSEFMPEAMRALLESKSKKRKRSSTILLWLGLCESSVEDIPLKIRIAADSLLAVNVDYQTSMPTKNAILNDVIKQLKRSDIMTVNEAMNIADIWAMDKDNRWRLYRLWRKSYVDTLHRCASFFQTQGYQVCADETNARIEAAGRGVLHDFYLSDVTGAPKDHLFLVQWLGLETLQHEGATVQIGDKVIHENASKLFAFQTSNLHQNPDVLHIYQTILSHILDNNVMSPEEVAVICDAVYDLELSDRWRLYRFWRDSFIRILHESLHFFSNTGCMVYVEEAMARINASYTGIIHEVYLNDVTHVWSERQRLQRQSSSKENTDHSEILHWLHLERLCPCVMLPAQQQTTPTCAEKNEWYNYIYIKDESEMRQEQLVHDDDDDDRLLYYEQKRNLRREAENDLALHMTSNRLPAMGSWNEWTTMESGRKRQNEINRRLQSAKPMTQEEARQIQDVWTLGITERWRLYVFFRNAYVDRLKDDLAQAEIEYNDACERKKELRIQEDAEIMRDATILGMTTTGAANHRAALQQIRPRIVVVEEAAEVLEAHIVTTLSEGCQHLILIGDHKQLRPSANVYELAKKFNLEISLFERMVNNGVTYNCLELQHRMRPEIAILMKPIYPELKNHESVDDYENIKGVSSNIYFIDHHELETNNEELRSKSNDHEARYMTALCKYFLQQGYKADKITILTMYTGQLLRFKEIIRNEKHDFSGVHVSAVDNFQGEENDIVLLSLVRSNEHGSIGFLSIDNRVCVALSRAKKGLYVIGNFTLLASPTKSNLWSKLIHKIRADGRIGKELQLCCQNHPDNIIMASKPEDFKKAPAGGCMKFCDTRLACGHVCTRRCHPDDMEHNKFECKKPCTKECENHHKCELWCSQKCKCLVPMEKVIPKCEHVQQIPCFMPPEEFECQTVCKAKLCDRGHTCKKRCHYEIKCGDCTVLVEKTVPGCGHKQMMQCCTSPLRFKCLASCERRCTSGHRCKKVCQMDCGDCPEIVSKTIQRCGHTQSMPCSKSPDTFNCRAPCDKTCDQGHGCKKRCYEACGDCPEKVDKEVPGCGHIQRMPCSLSPDGFPCSAPCDKTCANGHRCRNLCSQNCEKCSIPVEKKIERCGHIQSMLCSQSPDAFKCKANCDRRCIIGHACKKLCHVECGLCTERVLKTFPTCGHTQLMQCHKDPMSVDCKRLCDREKPCGHKCFKQCFQKCGPCFETVVKTVARCGHQQKMACSQSPDTYRCNAPCEKMCSHGHQCRKKCFEKCGECSEMIIKTVTPCGHRLKMKCSQNPEGYKCDAPCKKWLGCGHLCTRSCSEECIEICQEETEKTLPSCGHKMKMQCFLPVTSCFCRQPCRYCNHKCTLPCGSGCRTKCKVRVKTTLPCGHSVNVECRSEKELITCSVCTTGSMDSMPVDHSYITYGACDELMDDVSKTCHESTFVIKGQKLRDAMSNKWGKGKKSDGNAVTGQPVKPLKNDSKKSKILNDPSLNLQTKQTPDQKMTVGQVASSKRGMSSKQNSAKDKDRYKSREPCTGTQINTKNVQNGETPDQKMIVGEVTSSKRGMSSRQNSARHRSSELRMETKVQRSPSRQTNTKNVQNKETTDQTKTGSHVVSSKRGTSSSSRDNDKNGTRELRMESKEQKFPSREINTKNVQSKEKPVQKMTGSQVASSKRDVSGNHNSSRDNDRDRSRELRMESKRNEAEPNKVKNKPGGRETFIKSDGANKKTNAKKSDTTTPVDRLMSSTVHANITASTKLAQNRPSKTSNCADNGDVTTSKQRSIKPPAQCNLDMIETNPSVRDRLKLSASHTSSSYVHRAEQTKSAKQASSKRVLDESLINQRDALLNKPIMEQRSTRKDRQKESAKIMVDGESVRCTTPQSSLGGKLYAERQASTPLNQEPTSKMKTYLEKHRVNIHQNPHANPGEEKSMNGDKKTG